VPGTEPSAKFGLAVRPSPEESRIVLPLQLILSELPGFQLNGSPTNVPDDARIEFPMSMIEPQLASGRVSIPARIFEHAVPQAYRRLFVVDPNETPVALPLQEIVKQLPDTALRVRADQEETTVTEAIETPFSIKAQEDAKNLQSRIKENEEVATFAPSVADAPLDPPAEARKTPISNEGNLGEAKTIDTEGVTETKTNPSGGTFAPENHAVAESGPGEPDVIDAKRAIARASGLSGMAGCLVSFTDGLTLAGNIPGDLAIDGICSIAPALIDKIDNHLEDTKLGGLIAMTLHCGESSLTFFKQDKLSLTAWHKNGQDLSAETREQLAQLLQKVSRRYQEPSHVDH